VFVRNRGWVAARELSAGDTVRGLDGRWTGIDGIVESDVAEAVHNIQVSRWHTFFVGEAGWGFSVWVHNVELCNLLDDFRKARLSGDATAAAKAADEIRNKLSKMSPEDLAKARLNDPKVRAALDGILDEGIIDNLPRGKTHRHHSDPKFMGGDPKQPTTDISIPEHQALHNDLNDFLRGKVDGAGNHMRPQPGNPGAKIRDNFTDKERLDATAEFYKKYRSKYPEAARDFFKQHPHLK
jgi:hypothetical protein